MHLFIILTCSCLSCSPRGALERLTGLTVLLSCCAAIVDAPRRSGARCVGGEPGAVVPAPSGGAAVEAPRDRHGGSCRVRSPTTAGELRPQTLGRAAEQAVLAAADRIVL